MAWIEPSKVFHHIQQRLKASRKPKNESGIALFLVLSTVTVLAVIVTEFTYVAQVNARLAFDSSDQLKAHYLALTGLKISLLRLKAYQTLKGVGGKDGGAGGGTPQLPRALLEQIWRFPFSYPIPKDLPGMSTIAKDEIQKFQGDSSLEGRFTATIDSDSNRMNLNSILPAYAAAIPKTTPTPKSPNDDRAPDPRATPAAGTKYDPKEAREGMKNFISNVVLQKFKEDQDFAQEYRDFNIDELMDNILGWVDPTYTPKNASGRQTIPYKRAPFYSVSELKMIYPVDDGLYQLLAPQFTAAPTTGMNVNTIAAPLLHALFPNMTDIEVEEFFKFRDATDVDNTFKDEKSFWDYMTKSVGSVGSKAEEIRQKFLTQGVVFIVDEETFKILVTAEVNKAMRVIEAWVTLSKNDSRQKKKKPAPGTNPNGQPIDDTGVNPDAALDAESPENPNNPPANIGLKITFMRES
jgi:type II secretory pathway component PulK